MFKSIGSFCFKVNSSGWRIARKWLVAALANMPDGGGVVESIHVCARRGHVRIRGSARSAAGDGLLVIGDLLAQARDLMCNGV